MNRDEDSLFHWLRVLATSALLVAVWFGSPILVFIWLVSILK